MTIYFIFNINNKRIFFLYIGIINYKLIKVTKRGLEKVIKCLVQQKVEVKSTQEAR